MAACENIDLTKDQTTSLLQNIEALLKSNALPQTIVQYVCTELGTPSINETNYCIIPCVSTCVYSYAVVSGTPPVATYKNVNAVLVCVKQCFPTFSTSSCSGSNTSTKSRGCSKNTKKNKEDQKNNMNKCRGKCLKSLTDQRSRCFSNLGISCSSYATTLSMIAEHLSEVTFANLTKRIGAAIDWIAKIWKAIKDSTNSIINWSKVAGEAVTSSGPSPTHLVKAAQDALTTLQGFLTDQLKNIGQYIEQIGQFLHDLADRMWDMKETAFCIRSLSSTINDVLDIVSNINNRQTVANNACNSCISTHSSLYNTQFNYTSAMDAATLTLAAASQVGLNNLNSSPVDVYVSLDNLNLPFGVSVS